MSKALREEFAKVKGEAMEVIGTAKRENRELTGEEKQANEARFARCNVIKATLDDEARFAGLNVADVPADVLAFARGNHSPKGEPDRQTFDANAHKAAVNQFIRTGQVPHEAFTIVAGAGGVTMPSTTPVLLKRVKNPYKAALQAFGLEILNVPGNGNITVFDDSANTAVVIPQDSTAHNYADPTILNLTGDVLYDSKATWFSNTYLAQAGFDPVQFFRPALDARIEYAQTTAWTTAILAAASVGVTGASTTGITYAELVAMKYSLPVASRQDGVFLVSSGFMQNIETMVDDNGRPLYRDSISDDAPDRLLGWPVFVVEGLATPAANAKTAIVASASSLLVREFGPRRLVRYENDKDMPDQVGVRMFANGGLGIVGSSVKVFKQGA